MILFVIYCYKKYKEKCDRYFLTTNEYPRMKILEDKYLIIKSEIPKFDINTITITRETSDWLNDRADKLFNKLKDNDNWIRSGYDNNVWFNYPLMYKKIPIGKAEKTCPNTINILRSLNNIQVAGYSLLIPKSKIDYHNDLTGPSYDSMAFNMLLTDDDDADLKMKINNKIYEYKHKEGKAVIFNSEEMHSAENYTNSNRIILYIDFETK